MKLEKKWFIAAGDDETDDTAVIESASRWAAGGPNRLAIVHPPSATPAQKAAAEQSQTTGVYLVEGTYKVKPPLNLEGSFYGSGPKSRIANRRKPT